MDVADVRSSAMASRDTVALTNKRRHLHSYLWIPILPPMTSPNDDPRQSPAAALAHQLRMFARGLKRRLREQADTGDLKPSHTAVLLRLEENGPATTSALARVEGMRSQSMGAIVAALEKAGLVTGVPDPADGRQTLLSLTERCRHLISHGRAARQDWLAHTIETRLSSAERDQLAQTIPLLARLVADRDDA